MLCDGFFVQYCEVEVEGCQHELGDGRGESFTYRAEAQSLIRVGAAGLVAAMRRGTSSTTWPRAGWALQCAPTDHTLPSVLDGEILVETVLREDPGLRSKHEPMSLCEHDRLLREDVTSMIPVPNIESLSRGTVHGQRRSRGDEGSRRTEDRRTS